MHLIYYVLVTCNVIFRIYRVSAILFVNCDQSDSCGWRNQTYPRICGQSDSCGWKNQTYPRLWSQEFYRRNCFCDNWCAEYEDCCYDAPIRNAIPHRPDYFPYQCLETYRIGRIYVKNLCYKDWPSDYIKRSCEQSSIEDEYDILKLVPVFDVTSNLTYKNVFCAVCNNAIPRYLKSWDMVITCPLKDVFLFNESKSEIEKALERVQFNFITNKWEVLITRSMGNGFLLQCTQKGVKISQELIQDPSKFRSCKTNIIFFCDPSWKTPLIADLCVRGETLYRYLILSNGSFIQTYKNVYCATCNFINTSLLTCFDNGLYAPVAAPIPDVISFSLRFMTNNAETAFNTRCPAGQIYDEWSKHCEYITCNSKLSQTRGICQLKSFWYKLKMRNKKMRRKTFNNV